MTKLLIRFTILILTAVLFSFSFANENTDKKDEASRKLGKSVKKLKDINKSLVQLKSADSKVSSTTSDSPVTMEQLSAQLSELQQEIVEIKTWIDKQDGKKISSIDKDVNQLNKVKNRNYLQFQYRDSDEFSPESTTTRQHSFAPRELRFIQTDVIDPRTSMKLSFEGAAGPDAINFQLKDAFLIYDIEQKKDRIGTQALFGQQPIPMGYDLERSSADRELPERAIYNRVMFAGERGRGIYFKHGISKNAFVHAGLWDALAYLDQEQAGKIPGPGGRLGITAGVRYAGKHLEMGLSGFSGKRPAFTSGTPAVISPVTDREFLYLDAAYNGFLTSKLSMRGELMVGRDRVPVGANVNASAPGPGRTATKMVGWQAQASYAFNSRNQISFRYEQFDPDVHTGSNMIFGYGLSYSYYLNPGAKITTSLEHFDNPFRAPSSGYDITTVRAQFRLF